MTIDQLILALEDYRDEFGGEAEVKLMTQSNYPFEHIIAGVCARRDLVEDEEEWEDMPARGDRHRFGPASEGRLDVFLVEERQSGYGYREAWDAAHK